MNLAKMCHCVCAGHGELNAQHAQRNLFRQDKGHRQRSPVSQVTGHARFLSFSRRSVASVKAEKAKADMQKEIAKALTLRRNK